MIVFHIDKIVVNDEFLVPEAIAIAEPLMLNDLKKCYRTESFCYQLSSFISGSLRKRSLPIFRLKNDATVKWT